MRGIYAYPLLRSVALLVTLVILGTGCGSAATAPARGFTTPTGGASAGPRQADQPDHTPLSTISWQGGNWFLLGVNYPWHKYGNDFGANAWGSYGVHDPATYAIVDADFAQLAQLGARTLRWFVFADGRAGITFDNAGMPTGLDQFVLRDLDAALEIAERHNIYLNLVLLDFLFMSAARVEHGVQMGGHAEVINSAIGQQALLEHVFAPLFQRYATSPYILSWEVMNEPEWALSDAGKVDKRVRHPSTLANFRHFTQQVVDAVHRSTQSYATVGCASVKWLHNWVGLGLDYYQAHYYDWMQPLPMDNLYARRFDQLSLDRPLVVGEFPASGSTTANLQQYLDTWYASGYAGAWAWSYKAVDEHGAPNAATFAAWAAAHAPAVNIPAAEKQSR